MSLTKVSYSMINGAPANVLDFGAKGDGITDDTDAIQAALNLGGELFIPKGTYLVDYLTTPVAVTISGVSRELSIIKRKSSATINKELLANTAIVRVCVYNLQFDGNRANNPNQGTGNFASGVALAAGSGVIDNCYFHDFNNHCIITGGEDRYFTSNTAYAKNITISNNLIDNGNTVGNHGDGIRPTRTDGLYITGNTVLNGYSSIRLNYYNKNVLISNNYCEGATLDVGITMGLGSDCTITGNICKGSLVNHGIELAGCKRVTVTGNIVEGNAGHGILLDIYGPPAGANYAGYIDGVLITNPTQVSPTDCIVSSNLIKSNSLYGAQDIETVNTLINGNTFIGNTTGALISTGSSGTQTGAITNNLFTTGGIEWSGYQFKETTYGNRFQEASNLTFQPTYGQPRNTLEPITNIAAWTGIANGSLIRDQGQTVYWIDNAVLGNAYTNFIDITGIKGDFIYETEFRSDTGGTFDFVIQLYLAGVFVATLENSTGLGLTTSYVKRTANNTTSATADAAFDTIRFTYKALAGQTNDVYIKYLNVY